MRFVFFEKWWTIRRPLKWKKSFAYWSKCMEICASVWLTWWFKIPNQSIETQFDIQANKFGCLVTQRLKIHQQRVYAPQLWNFTYKLYKRIWIEGHSIRGGLYTVLCERWIKFLRSNGRKLKKTIAYNLGFHTVSTSCGNSMVWSPDMLTNQWFWLSGSLTAFGSPGDLYHNSNQEKHG